MTHPPKPAPASGYRAPGRGFFNKHGMSYPGGKGASGVAQKIISLMPPHEFYGELFAGAGYIFKTKRPAKSNLAIDLDDQCLMKINGLDHTNAEWINDGAKFKTALFDAIEYIQTREIWPENTLLYLDPPYLPSTLSRPKNSVRNGQRYQHKFGVEAHQRLLELITPLKCMVMISGYASAMYDCALCAPTWTRKTFMAQTRGGMREEVVWMNFNPDAIEQRHDWRFWGDTFRERERLQKKLKRLRRKLTEVNIMERNFLLDGISDLYESSRTVVSNPK